MNPLFLFGIGVALAGCGAVGTILNSCREILIVGEQPRRFSISAAQAVVVLLLIVDFSIVGSGLWVAFAAAGGVHG